MSRETIGTWIGAIIGWALVYFLATHLAHADCASNFMECTADTSLKVYSFTTTAAEVGRMVTAARVDTANNLHYHKISPAQARVVQVKVDKARILLQQAIATCNPNATGTCQGDAIKASSLLTQAQKAIK